jgi:ParB family chromosome partitioning protein
LMTTSAAEIKEKVEKRRALGRGLESLLPGPRPSGGGTAGSGPAGASGAMPSGGAAASAASVGAAGAIGVASAAVAPIGAAASGAGVSGAVVDGAPVPGVIAELQGQAARRQVDGHEVMDIAIELIDKNPHQTRRFMDDGIDALMELSDSIKVQGVLQPITVRPGKDGRYILVAGERRMRASKMAERKTIPAIVRVVSEQQAAELTIIENLQREDLNCMELALAYALLSKHFNLTQEQIGARVGVARETVSNYMRLARLPDSVQRHLAMGRLEFSHARVLLNLQDSDVIARVADKAERENWSVDKLEKFVLFDPSMKDVKKNVPKASGGARWVDPNVRAAQRDLEGILGLRVRIRDRNGKGKITLEYSTLEDFDRVVGMLKGKG